MLYVASCSEVSLSEAQISELALGMEAYRVLFCVLKREFRTGEWYVIGAFV